MFIFPYLLCISYNDIDAKLTVMPAEFAIEFIIMAQHNQIYICGGSRCRKNTLERTCVLLQDLKGGIYSLPCLLLLVFSQLVWSSNFNCFLYQFAIRQEIHNIIFVLFCSHRGDISVVMKSQKTQFVISLCLTLIYSCPFRQFVPYHTFLLLSHHYTSMNAP